MLVLIEENVQRALVLAFGMANWLLKPIDNTHRFTHLGIAVPIESSDYVGWMTQTELDVSAELYPQQKPFTIIVPQAAGGASDVVLRIVAQKISVFLKQTVVVDNRPGAGGKIEIGAVACAPADGYTLLFNVSSAHLVNPFLYKNPGFSPEKDFGPIAPFATGGMVLVAAPSFAPNNVKELIELIELAKAKPGELTYGSAGNETLTICWGKCSKTAIARAVPPL